MTTPHSPLPPPPPADLELLQGQLMHLITVAEVTADRVAHIENRMEEVSKAERALNAISRRLTGVAIRLMAARAIQAAVPASRWAVATVGGAFVGGFLGTVLWQWMHAAAALAH